MHSMTSLARWEEFSRIISTGEIGQKRTEALIKDLFPEQEILIEWLADLASKNPRESNIEAWQAIFEIYNTAILDRCIEILWNDFDFYTQKKSIESDSAILVEILKTILKQRDINTENNKSAIYSVDLICEKSISIGAEIANGSVGANSIESSDKEPTDLEEIIESITQCYRLPTTKRIFQDVVEFLCALDLWRQDDKSDHYEPCFLNSYLGFSSYIIRDHTKKVICKIAFWKIRAHECYKQNQLISSAIPNEFILLIKLHYEMFLKNDNSFTQLFLDRLRYELSMA